MYVNIAVLNETKPGERRLAMVPDVAVKLTKLGGRLHMQPGCGGTADLADDAFAGVTWVKDVVSLVGQADVVLAVQPPPVAVVDAMREGAILISFVYENDPEALVKRLLAKKITCFAMERIPRISRAQPMDALSSQSALAGYLSVMLGAMQLKRVLPQVSSAAGVIGPARVLVMGLGVAGLEAVATAHRLGAVVEGYDVRAETAEQIVSLGATFVQTGVNATGKGGYARALTEAERTKVTAALTRHIAAADLIITTASVPGHKAPKLISKAQVAGMKAGAVIIDLSAEGGGNCEESAPGKTVRVGLVTIAAPLDVASMLSEDASTLYAHNVSSLLGLMLKDNIITIDWTDAVLKQTALTHDGKLVDAPAKAA